MLCKLVSTKTQEEQQELISASAGFSKKTSGNTTWSIFIIYTFHIFFEFFLFF